MGIQDKKQPRIIAIKTKRITDVHQKGQNDGTESKNQMVGNN